MINFKSNSLLGLIIFFVLLSFGGQAFGQNMENEVPSWVKQATEIWIDGQISDSEFLALIENVLEKNILPEEMESKEIMKHTAKTVIHDIPELYEEKTSELVPHWVKDRAEWWVEGKINDIQFLRTIHYLREVGYLEYTPEKSIFSNDETLQSSLDKFLLNDKEVLKITKLTKWRILSTEYEFEEKEGVIDSVKIIFSDITRVYEPTFYKFKVPSLTMQISEFNNPNDLDNYWNSFGERSKKEIFDSSYAKGNPNENSQCLFNYNLKGAVTSCVYDNLIIQVIIFDQHSEHYNYDTKNLILDETEPTSRFASEILKKISYYKNHYINSQLYLVLQNTNQDKNLDKSLNGVQIEPKSIELEKSVVKGVENFSCIRDDFGLVTISGQYYNDDTRRAQVDLEISFLDKTSNIMGKTSITFNDLTEFESKRFVGHSKWNENFYSCQIKIE
ncbi:MAG: hypothetical protein ACW9W9_01550 [Candidatus Nitrosopumilus sp. Bin_571-38]|jgi:hypothetical protein